MAHRGSTVEFLLLKRFSVGIAVEYSSCSILNYVFACSFYVGQPGGHLLLKSWNLGFPLVLFSLCRFIICIPFPFDVRDRMWNMILSLPFHLL